MFSQFQNGLRDGTRLVNCYATYSRDQKLKELVDWTFGLGLFVWFVYRYGDFFAFGVLTDTTEFEI